MNFIYVMLSGQRSLPEETGSMGQQSFFPSSSKVEVQKCRKKTTLLASFKIVTQRNKCQLTLEISLLVPRLLGPIVQKGG